MERGKKIMGKLRFTFACNTYDRVFALIDGTVIPEGMDFNFIPLEPEEIFWRQLKHQEWDASEMSLSSYIMARSRGDDSFIAIPVFPSRMFRHSSAYINTQKGITKPNDLRGKIIGVPEYQITAALWFRGMLQHEYGVHPRDMQWRSGGEETPGREEKINLQLPSDIDYQPIPKDKTLSQMLQIGEIDAIISARPPSCFTNGTPNINRLFVNYPETEREYYLKTGIFPIMHTVVIKRSVCEKNSWVAMALYKACQTSKDIMLQKLQKWVALYATLPWLVSEVERTKEIMGDDWWPYGIDKNRQTLETSCEYSFEQGLSTKRMTLEELFAPETFNEFKI
jgi:4,5-dihydroxyphthalate decarboxylase